MLYRITLFTQDTHAPYHTQGTTEVVGTLAQATARAKQWLPTEYDSLYGARTTRRPFVQVHSLANAKGDRGKVATRVATVEPTVYLVPSVGDLGYSP